MRALFLGWAVGTTGIALIVFVPGGWLAVLALLLAFAVAPHFGGGAK